MRWENPQKKTEGEVTGVISDVKKKIDYWIDIAQYDLETARAMLKSGRFLYVGFMCHQVIEKIFKGFYVFAKKR